ncbi:MULTISPECIES: hypothetical protein [unclassified Microbacterium]|uniref:hypothetical protein n=1 Tax=unclassified Microbacterium TaxID=2609290 RepID=UPI0037466BCF
MTVRGIVSSIALAFTAYLAARGLLLSSDQLDHPWLFYLALPLYLLVTWALIFLGSRPQRGVRAPVGAVPRTVLPLWAAVAALAVAVVVPNAVMYAVFPSARAEPFATWVIGGIGALMTIVMVRRRPIVAWAGIALMSLSVMAWLGPLAALSLGLPGSLVWVAAAQLLMFALDRAARDTARLAELQQAASAWQASQAGRQRERRVQVQRALQAAGPILGRTIETGGNLRPDERLEARLAEGRLRDELRGRRLLDDGVRAQLEAVRRRGIAVTMFDEGGLDGIDDDALTSVRAELAETLRDASSTRLIIRTSPHEQIAVTVVGRSGDGESLSDEDSVDLWREIRRPD